MQFPSEFPVQAMRQVARFVTGQDKDYGRISLAGWELIGYGLGKGFPGAAYLADAPPPAALSTDLCEKIVAANDEQLKAMAPELELLIQTVGPLLFKWLMRKLNVTI
jgi:hypothetical protein